MADYRPNQSGGTPIVDYINSVLKGNLTEKITDLERWSGKDVTILGSGALVRSLLGDGLLDELRLMIHPVVLGGGKRLFEEGGDQKVLKLVDSKTFSTGVVSLTYQPDRKKGER